MSVDYANMGMSGGEIRDIEEFFKKTEPPKALIVGRILLKSVAYVLIASSLLLAVCMYVFSMAMQSVVVLVLASCMPCVIAGVAAVLIFLVGLSCFSIGKLQGALETTKVENKIKASCTGLRKVIESGDSTGCDGDAISLLCRRWNSLIINSRMNTTKIKKIPKFDTIFREFARFKMLADFAAFAKKVRGGASGDGEEVNGQLANLFAALEKDFNSELETISGKGYDVRMRYDCMDNFLYIKVHEMETEMEGYLQPSKTIDSLGKKCERQKINHFAFSGGGAKGCPYDEVIRELVDFKGDYCTSGISVGSIAAAMAAFNRGDVMETLKDLQKIFLGKYKKTIHKFPLSIEFVRKKGIAILEDFIYYLNEKFFDQVKAALDGMDDEAIRNVLADDGDGCQRIIELKKATVPIPVKFSDITLLRKLPFEVPFHSFETFAWCFEEQKNVAFNELETPDLSVAEAIRIAISLPIFIACIHLKEGKGEVKTYGDGGFYEGTPTAASFREEYRNTLYIVFEDSGTSYMTQCGPQNSDGEKLVIKRAGMRAKMGRFVGFVLKYEDNAVHEYRNLCSDSHRVLVLPHGQLTTTNFFFTEEIAMAAMHQARLTIGAWKIQHENGYIFSSVTEEHGGAEG
ncbi:MAG: patatin-like phospholipase family protein [Puniceicoccales bacterium]|jgi:predicted acylesterase/phospholipase RssA|nr:patatin-like phospholipase family protein [Puniceicoccales bacterium]